MPSARDAAAQRRAKQRRLVISVLVSLLVTAGCFVVALLWAYRLDWDVASPVNLLPLLLGSGSPVIGTVAGYLLYQRFQA